MPLPTVVPSRISASWQGGDGKRVGRPPPPPDPSNNTASSSSSSPPFPVKSPSKKRGREEKREGGGGEGTPPPPPSSRQEAIDSIDDIAGEGEKRCWEERGGQGREEEEDGGDLPSWLGRAQLLLFSERVSKAPPRACYTHVGRTSNSCQHSRRMLSPMI